MTFLDALHAAKDTPDPEDYINRVKRVVKNQLASLDSTSVVESTPYFNHTAVPDFIISWPGDATKKHLQKREVFLRHSYQSIADDNDEHYLERSDAIVMALRPGHEDQPGHSESEATAAATASRLLITDAAAIQVVGTPMTDETPGPLSELVRANFVRGARGHIDPVIAARLVRLDRPGEDTSTSSAADTITTSFAEDAAARITRTAQLIDLAFGTPSEAQAELVGGRLSHAELRYLLPWLLSREPGLVQPEFWVYLGTLFDFRELESIRENLVGLDLTPLVQANAHHWSARRAYVGLAISDNIEEGLQATQPRRWGFQPGSLSALSVDLGERRLFLAQSGALLKPRPSSSSAVWEQVRDTVEGMKLRRVNLRGIRRSVSVNAEQSPDIQSDVEEVARSLDDRYFVDEVTLRFPAPDGQEGAVDLDVHFGQSLVIAETDASIADLARVALGVLDYRDPAPSAQIDHLLGD